MRIGDIIAQHEKDTKSANLKKNVGGLGITIEHPRGTIRKLHNDAGKLVYQKSMMADYGYFDGTKGRDGDEVDVFVGPMKECQEAFIIHMRDMGPDKNAREDEDKVFIGYPSADAAKQAFLAHYPPNFYEGMTVLPFATFKKKLKKASLPYRNKKIHASTYN